MSTIILAIVLPSLAAGLMWLGSHLERRRRVECTTEK